MLCDQDNKVRGKRRKDCTTFSRPTSCAVPGSTFRSSVLCTSSVRDGKKGTDRIETVLPSRPQKHTTGSVDGGDGIAEQLFESTGITSDGSRSELFETAERR